MQATEEGSNNLVAVHAVTLIKSGSLPRTSSGKVRHGTCREAFLAGGLEAVSEWRETDGLPGAPAALTREELSLRTRVHWMTTTKAGLSTAWSSILGLLVGLVVTCQTLYAVTASSWREYAVLEALGIPTSRMVCIVLAQSFWAGAGLLLALPAAFAIAYGVNQFGSGCSYRGGWSPSPGRW